MKLEVSDPIHVPEDFLVPAVVWTVGTPSEAESVGAGMERGNSWNLECNISGQHFRIFGHILKVQTRHFLDRSDTWERHSVRKRQHNMTILFSC